MLGKCQVNRSISHPFSNKPRISPFKFKIFWQNVNFWKSVNSKHFQPTTCLKRCYLNWGRTNDRNFFETCHSNLKSSYGCSSCIYSHFIILRGRHLSSLHSKESGSLKSDFELTTTRDSSLTKETNWLGIFSRHESFNAREEEDREALGIRLRLLMGDGDYPLEKCIYTVTGLLLPRK